MTILEYILGIFLFLSFILFFYCSGLFLLSLFTTKKAILNIVFYLYGSSIIWVTLSIVLFIDSIFFDWVELENIFQVSKDIVNFIFN